MKLLATVAMITLPCLLLGQPIGEVDVAGTTYNSSQHSGTCGRMVSEDVGGFVHVAWMNSLTSDLSTRHAYYNVWDPATHEFSLGTGVQVDASSRAGYVTQATSADGWCFPAYHATLPGDMFPHAAAAIDFLPRTGAFTNNWPAWLYNGNQPISISFPKVGMAQDTVLHMVSMELFMGDPPWGGIYYSRGLPVITDGYGETIDWQVVDGANHEFLLLDTSAVIAHDVACSLSGDRVAVAYIRTVSPYNNDNMGTDPDVFLTVSEDGGLTWSDPASITQFIPPDETCFGETGNWACCNRDTLRPYFELSVLIDESDVIHVTFPTVRYRHWVDSEVADEETPTAAMIWHWSENTGSFSPVAECWQPDVTRSLPSTNAMVSRPSLSVDTTNGYLYCSYLQFDSSEYSTDDRMNADAFVSVSTDNGAHWSVGVNVTNTEPETVPGGPGQNRSEADATSAIFTGDSLKLFYELDRDAGAGDVPTSKDMVLQHVPAAAIPTTPLMPEASMHVEIIPCGESADDGGVPLPRDLALAAYPNPFNSVARIRLDLPQATNLQLLVYDVLGRETKTLAASLLSAGVHEIEFDASDLPSGLYFVRLQTPTQTLSRKLLLLK